MLEFFAAIGLTDGALIATILGPIIAIVALWAQLRSGKKTKRIEPDPPATRVAFPKNVRGFVGRKEELARLGDYLAEGGKVVVRGLGGHGKTTLAKEFGGLATGYDHKLWVNAAELGLAVSDILVFGEAAFGVAIPEPQTPEAARAVIARLNATKALVVFDNVDSFKEISPLMPDGDAVRLIVTTRTAAGYTGFKRVDVGVLGFETEGSPAVELLVQEADREDDRAATRVLAEKLGGLPLGLVIAGGLVKQSGEGFAVWSERLDQILLTQPESDDYPDSIRAAVKLSYDRLSDDAKWVADLFAWWAPEGLDGTLISDAPEGEFWGYYLKDIPDDLAELASDATRVRMAVSQVQAQSLVVVEEDGLAMHRLTAASLRLLAKEEAREAAATLLMAQYPAGTNGAGKVDNWPVCRRLTPHARALYETNYAPNSEAMDALLNQCGVFLRTQGDLEGTIECYQGSLKFKASRLDEDSRDVALALGNLAQQLIQIGKSDEAIQMMNRAIDLNEKYRPDSEGLADSYMQAVFIHGTLGKGGDREAFEVALDYLSKAKPIHERIFGLNSQEMSRCLVHESFIKDQLGDKVGSILDAQKALAIRREGDAANLGYSLSNLGALYLKAGLTDKAVKHLEEALEIRERIYAEVPNHPDLKTTADFTATALLVQGRAGRNPTLRAAKAQAICLRRGLVFDAIKADAELYPVTPQIDLPE